MYASEPLAIGTGTACTDKGVCACVRVRVRVRVRAAMLACSTLEHAAGRKSRDWLHNATYTAMACKPWISAVFQDGCMLPVLAPFAMQFNLDFLLEGLVKPPDAHTAITIDLFKPRRNIFQAEDHVRSPALLAAGA